MVPKHFVGIYTIFSTRKLQTKTSNMMYVYTYSILKRYNRHFLKYLRLRGLTSMREINSIPQCSRY